MSKDYHFIYITTIFDAFLQRVLIPSHNILNVLQKNSLGN